MKPIFILAIVAIVFGSCKKNDDHGINGIFKGPDVNVHGGKAWSWVQLNAKGEPERIGISIDDKALNNVPVGGAQEGHDHGGANSWVVKFHQKGSVLPFNFIGLNWNPNGHEPEVIYGKPHFDFHFYTMTPDQVAAIPAYEQDSVKFKNAPGPDYFPPTYINAGGGVPQMGAHWVDFTSPELNGQPFGQTFLYGSYDGNVTFYEPMITLEFLKNNSNFQRTFPTPAKVQKTGWYPSVMRVVKHDKVTEVILDGFVLRQNS